MSIHSLPDSTARAIGSSLVLNDAISVVKELVENALDASATTISVEISSNTLDIVQIKDNGSGIGVEDRQLVCKRGCTSKIRTINDLERLGGSSLGFRGEALASVAELSDGVLLTTRVDGESVGTLLRYGKAGVLMSSASASHPVGTTVRVTNLLKLVPVRKQAALKNASKTLSSIKKLLQGYAFARGVTRFSLKVLKGKNGEANWQYSPVDDSKNLKEVGTKIVGHETTSNCEYRSSFFTSRVDENEGGGEYSVHALLAGLEDTRKLNNVGHFVSIDGRPVSTIRGCMKEIVKLYRSHYRTAVAGMSNSASSSDPFLCMHLDCPRGSYDVNLEPAKDEVLFTNTTFVISLVNDLFKDFYHAPASPNGETIAKSRLVVSTKSQRPFDVLLARKVPNLVELVQDVPPRFNLQLEDNEPAPTNILEHENTPGQPATSPMDSQSHQENSPMPIDSTQEMPHASPPFKVHSNMYPMDQDELYDLTASSPVLQEVQWENDDNETNAATNPWAIARLNAPARCSIKVGQENSPGNSQLSSPASGLAESPSQRILSNADIGRTPLGSGQTLPSCSTSPQSLEDLQNPGPPLRRRPLRPQGDREGDLSLRRNSDALAQTPKHGAGLDNWVKPTGSTTDLPRFIRVSDMYDKDGRFDGEPDHDVQEAEQLLGESGRREYRTELTFQSTIKRPFKSPIIRLPGHARTDSDLSLQLSDIPCTETQLLEDRIPSSTPIQPRPSQFLGSKSIPQPSTSLRLGGEPFEMTQPRNHDLDQIMDFEHRKKATIAQQRKGYGKPPGQGMDAYQLSQLQQASSQATQLSNESNSLAEPASISESIEGTATAAFENQSGEHEVRAKASTPNPHRNRYLAATRALSHRNTGDLDVWQGEVAGDCMSVEAGDEAGESSNFSEDDPRAYFMQHRLLSGETGGKGLTKTGLKIRRMKTQRLPLESIPIGLALHDIVAIQPFEIQDVLPQLEVTSVTDMYVKTGENQSLRWRFTGAEVDNWQKKLDTMIHDMYRAKVGEEPVTAGVEILLKRTLKVYCDNL